MERTINKGLEEKYGFKPFACSCRKCVEACTVQPCNCTPDDIISIIEEHHVSPFNFTKTMQCIYKMVGLTNILFPLIAIKGDMKGLTRKCSFFDENKGLCKIHEFKPMGGSHGDTHKSDMKKVLIVNSPDYRICESWILEENRTRVLKAASLALVNPLEVTGFMNMVDEARSKYRIIKEVPDDDDVRRYMRDVFIFSIIGG